MSEFRLTDGNLIVLYALTKTPPTGELPDYLAERVKVAFQTFEMVMRSKPDSQKTMVIVAASEPAGRLVKGQLVALGVPQNIIEIDSDSQSTGELIGRVHEMIQEKPNPPFIYFVGPYWVQDVYRSTVVSKLKDFKTQFYGAIDHRPVDEVDAERASDAPKKGGEYYKQKIKNKAVDVLLNVIFPD